MLELRKDYFLNRWVIISTERAKRPKDFRKETEQVVSKKDCPFCPGNENKTPPEIDRVEKNGEWVFRAFSNKFPAVKQEGKPEIVEEDTIFTHGNAFGSHEVVVETPNHEEMFWDLSEERIFELLKVLKVRLNTLKAIPGIQQVILFKNHGKEAGTSIEHEHLQLIAYNKTAASIQKEVHAANAFKRKHGKCPYCEIIEIEKKGPRRIKENNSFFALAPYASRFAFEAMLLPKEHRNNLADLSEAELNDLASCLKKVVGKLGELNAPYNLYFHESPKGKKLHFHVKVTPRLLSWGGFEMASDCIINTVSPEQAAEFYRQ